MAMRIPVGKEDFDEIRRTGLYYVDKTELIYDLIGSADNQVTFFTRPRRLGKTLNMSMMESFFDIDRDSRAVFEELDIARHREFCSEWTNQYPVLSISFKDVDGIELPSNRIEAIYMRLHKIGELCGLEGLRALTGPHRIAGCAGWGCLRAGRPARDFELCGLRRLRGGRT